MNLDDYLKLERCPHCRVDKPNLSNIVGSFQTQSDDGSNRRAWKAYVCRRCGGVVIAGGHPNHLTVYEYYPNEKSLSEHVPERVASYLKQAMDSIAAPSGAVMLCASAVDTMLKLKGYKEGSLYKRIDLATKSGVLTSDMAKWAHQVRLGANDERHADEDAVMPTVEDAKQAIEFAMTLADILFVLPSRVTRGIEATS